MMWRERIATRAVPAVHLAAAAAAAAAAVAFVGFVTAAGEALGAAEAA